MEIAALCSLLPADKARAATRVIYRGGRLDPELFAREGRPLSKAQREGLRAAEEAALRSRVVERAPSSDGSIRLVVELFDGERVETVAMPARAACVSTQIGCAVGCPFCASGLLGLERNLAADEIVEQVIHARREMRIDRVLYMGMGEPTHNLASVVAAVAELKLHAWISPRKQTLSTVGSCAALAELSAAAAKPCLALSLHSADERIRRELVPRASRDPLRELVAAASRYAKLQGKPIVFEWTLLEGVNDRDADVEQIAALLHGVRGYVNFIRWNPVAGLPFRPTSFERAVELREAVKARGILATIRASTGSDVDAACGQLRRRAQPLAGGETATAPARGRT